MRYQGLTGHAWKGFLAREAAPTKLGLYARVSTHEQQTLALQREAMTAYAQQRHGSIVLTVEEVGTGVSERRQWDILMRPPRRLAPSAFLLARGTRLAADIMG